MLLRVLPVMLLMLLMLLVARRGPQHPARCDISGHISAEAPATASACMHVHDVNTYVHCCVISTCLEGRPQVRSSNPCTLLSGMGGAEGRDTVWDHLLLPRCTLQPHPSSAPTRWLAADGGRRAWRLFGMRWSAPTCGPCECSPGRCRDSRSSTWPARSTSRLGVGAFQGQLSCCLVLPAAQMHGVTGQARWW
jgi:hypothetical protein